MDTIFPAMAQAILASDTLIRTRPAAIRGVVNAVLDALRDIIADPKRSAAEYVAAVPDHAG